MIRRAVPAPGALLRRGWTALQLAWTALYLTASAALGVRGVPPGPLGPFSIARFGDDRFYWTRFRRYGPIFKVLWNQNITICIVGFERARRLFAAHGRALLPLTIEIESFVPFGFMRRMAPVPHAHYRTLFVQALRVNPAVTWADELRELIREELARMASATRDTGTPSLTVALDRIATRSLILMFFGVEATQPQFPLIEGAFRRMGPHEFEYPLGEEQHAGFATLRALVGEAVNEAKSGMGWASADGVLGRLIGTDGAAVDETVVGNLIYMVEMGRYDVRSLMRWVLKYLSDAPDVVAELKGALAARADGTECPLAESIVLETLRLDQAEALNRAVVSDFEFEGYRIPKGSTLRVLIRESHQDAATFSAAERFQPCRFIGKTYPGHAYAPFGVGEHRCIAAALVVRLSQLLVEELASGYDWSVGGDGSRFRGRYHWEPAPGFDLVLRARPVATA
jgi:cytochrome P450